MKKAPISAEESALRRAVYRQHFRTHPIIIVDDSQDDRTLLATLLKPMVGGKHPVIVLDSGEALLGYLDQFEQSSLDPEAFEREMPGMVFLDLMMPRMSGLETLQHVRQRPLWHSTPITITTHSTDDSSIEKALEEGANAFLPKPFTKLDLFKAIKRTNNFSVIDV